MKQKFKRKLKFMSLFFGLLFVLTSCKSQHSDYIETEGTIIELSGGGTFLDKKPKQMVIEYTDQNGVTQIGKLDYDGFKEFPEVNNKINIQYHPQSPSELMRVDAAKKQNMFVTYGLLSVTSLILIGTGFGYWFAMRKGKVFRYKPILLIVVIILFLISLYAVIVGKGYNEIFSFID